MSTTLDERIKHLEDRLNQIDSPLLIHRDLTWMKRIGGVALVGIAGLYWALYDISKDLGDLNERLTTEMSATNGRITTEVSAINERLTRIESQLATIAQELRDR